MYKHLLYAWDLSEDGKAFAKDALKLAKTFGAKLSVVHVMEPFPTYGYPVVSDKSVELQEYAEKSMKALAEELEIEKDRLHIKAGPTKNVIVEIADEHGMDLIVLGSHGHSGLSFLLGSTANSVNNAANCDVLTMRVHAN